MRAYLAEPSRAGLRPVSAFVLLALVFIAVAVRLTALAEPDPEPRRMLRAVDLDYKTPPLYELVDRRGVPLAVSHASYAAEASPWTLWQVHTPERLLPALAEALELDDEQHRALERRLLSVDAHGTRRVPRWILTADEALALRAWLLDGGPGPGTGSLAGMWLEPCRPSAVQSERLGELEGPFFELAWQPGRVLAAATRERHRPELAGARAAAARWIDSLCRGLEPFLLPAAEREVRHAAARGARLPRGFQLDGRGEPVRVGLTREWVLDGLLPTRYALVADTVPARLLPGLRQLVRAHTLGPHSFWLRPTGARAYPAGEMAVLGRWGWTDDEGQRSPEPLAGLEHLGHALLEELERETGEVLRFGRAGALERALMLPRRPGVQRGYYLDHRRPVAPAVVETTLDLDLVRYTGRRLEQALEDSQAAGAMAIVLDLDTREVLALEWREAYRSTLYSPIQRLFTPGSTFKVVTMALALEAGLVRPDEVLDVGQGSLALTNDRGRVVRRIGEAEGFRRGYLTAAECLAFSSNSGLVQIGLRVPVETWKQATRTLGYGVPAARGLLPAGAYDPPGRIGEPEGRGGNAWARTRSHASVSFGDSISLNLVQHATAMASLLGGGEHTPLRFARAVHVDGERLELPRPERVRVVSERTSRELNRMLSLGAEVGTGSRLMRPDGCDLGTKTGTFQKLRNDVCSHLWGAAYEQALDSGKAWDDAAEHRRLRGRFGDGRRACYVSSIVAVGASPDGSRRALTLVIIDDPHAPGQPFGSRHAGPVAVDLLAEALGWTIDGQAPPASLPGGLWPMALGPARDALLPWRPEEG